MLIARVHPSTYHVIKEKYPSLLNKERYEIQIDNDAAPGAVYLTSLQTGERDSISVHHPIDGSRETAQVEQDNRRP